MQHGVLPINEAEKNAREIYRRLDLPDPDNIGNRYPHQVSGGQLQRCMVAMAMACKPDLIVFDEPTTALDVTTQIEVLSAIKDVIRQFNTASIYITHDLAVVAQVPIESWCCVTATKWNRVTRASSWRTQKRTTPGPCCRFERWPGKRLTSKTKTRCCWR